MKIIVLPILFATIAAIGNAIFAFGQKKSAGVENGLLFIAVSAVITVVLLFLFAPLTGTFNVENTLKSHWKAALITGIGLFITYIGFNLLYSRYGASQYVLYAVISIITTTIIVGVFMLKEPVNMYHKIAIALATFSVVFFSIGQSKL